MTTRKPKSVVITIGSLLSKLAQPKEDFRPPIEISREAFDKLNIEIIKTMDEIQLVALQSDKAHAKMMKFFRKNKELKDRLIFLYNQAHQTEKEDNNE